MLHKYRWYEYVLIYCEVALFLTFVLAPFVEAFVQNSKPVAVVTGAVHARAELFC